MVYFKDKLVVYGGYTGLDWTDEMHVFDIKKSECGKGRLCLVCVTYTMACTVGGRVPLLGGHQTLLCELMYSVTCNCIFLTSTSSYTSELDGYMPVNSLCHFPT